MSRSERDASGVTSYGLANAFQRPEHALLLQCARSEVTPDGAWAMVQLVRQPLNWPYLRAVAHRHGLMPLLAHNLGRFCEAQAPAAEMERLKDAFQTNARRNLFMTVQLAGLLGLLEVQGIPALAYKGPVTAAWAYGNLALRRFSDLDLLVAPATMQDAKAALTAAGFRRVEDLGHECSFHHEQNGIHVDLHSDLTFATWPTGLGFRRLWSRSRLVSLSGVRVRTLGPRHTLMVLCIEAGKDACTERNKLIRLSDIAEFVARQGDPDWKGFLRKAARLGQRRTVLFALRLARDIIGADLPQQLAQAVEQENMTEWAVRVRERLFLYADEGTRIHGPSFHSALRERRRDRLPMQFKLLRHELRGRFQAVQRRLRRGLPGLKTG